MTYDNFALYTRRFSEAVTEGEGGIYIDVDLLEDNEDQYGTVSFEVGTSTGSMRTLTAETGAVLLLSLSKAKALREMLTKAIDYAHTKESVYAPNADHSAG